nr:immunoglobulin heavy chain junction region [Mus musculus]
CARLSYYGSSIW